MWRWCPDVDDSKQRLNAQWAYVLENVPSLGKIVQDLSSLGYVLGNYLILCHLDGINNALCR